jgi:hypothetical protein
MSAIVVQTNALIEVATVEVATVEVATVEVATVEVATVEMATVEVATVEVATVEMATVEMATVVAVTAAVQHREGDKLVVEIIVFAAVVVTGQLEGKVHRGISATALLIHHLPRKSGTIEVFYWAKPILSEPKSIILMR